VWWDHQLGRRTLIAAFGEAFLSSVSAYSRIIYLVHAAPYWLVLADRRRELASGWKHLAFAACAFVALFVLSLFAVFWLRAAHYPDNADIRHNVKSELPQLVLQRWTGLEGVLAVGSSTERSLALMARAISESPKVGADSIYQRVATPRFREDQTRRFAFGSNAGPVALLLFSGSLAIVCAGMAALALLILVTEELARRWTANPFLLAVAGAALANVVNQTTFFYLTLIFVLQLWLAIALVGALARLPRRDA
jgi:hypothetical protein